MHFVQPAVGGSLTPEDPYQEPVLDTRVKNANLKKNFCTNNPITIHSNKDPLILIQHTWLQTKKEN